VHAAQTVMSLTKRVLVALGLGLLAGLLVLAHPTPALLRVVSWVEPIGILWVNAIRMTVVPLVVSLLITGVASCSNMQVVRGIGWRALVSFLGLLILVAALGLLIVPPLFAWFRMDPATIATLRENAGGGTVSTPHIPGFGEWVVSLVPTNPVKAASDGAMLPLVVFTLAFALALLKVTTDRRDAVLRFFHGVSDAMLVIVRTIIELAPIGVFALVLPVASRTGIAAAGALGYYVVVTAVAHYSAPLSGGSPCRTRSNVTVRASRVSGTSCRLQFEFLARVAPRSHRRQRTEAPASAERDRRGASACSIDLQSSHASALACGSDLPSSALRRAACAHAALSHLFDRDPDQL